MEPFVQTIPCCVPYWDQTQFLNAGGAYSEKLGFYVKEDAYLPAFEEWLPRKWQDRGDPPAPVLLPDMLPSSTWEANLRTALTQAEWDRLRKFCYQAAGNTCVACGSRGEPHVEAHEAWSFNEAAGVQKLVGLRCFCPTCHKAKHLGYANRIGRYRQVVDRLKWLNDWNDAELELELRKMADRQERLSQRKWTLDLSFLHSYGVR
ncbi:hypothetical protein LMG26857_03339 [Achromobacter anxifer]|uniref:hypothetical protein n=1 Tax=Achromobacter anxifer TaxID=1287737 RepID=UPI00155C6837|nr:hypothetical protein [Achromobacter anxifer]CAB5514280.1 hypothetical protein LMG26857_03339 [Achromobacter anxifer]